MTLLPRMIFGPYCPGFHSNVDGGVYVLVRDRLAVEVNRGVSPTKIHSLRVIRGLTLP
jgi:hypothetical protein